MKKLVLVIFLLAASLNAYAAQDQAYFAILAETKATKMVGMPAMPEMPEIDMSNLPPGVDPSMMAGMSAMLSGAPQRVLNIRLWSPTIAPADAFAYVTPPAGLKQGNKLDLALYRPKPSEGTSTSSGPGEFDPDSDPNFTIKIYWGSSQTVKPGQPKIIKWTGLTAEQKQAMKKQAKEAQAADSYFYKPNWTTAYWPTPAQPGKIANDASLVGSYALTTNYAGNVTIEAPSNVNFLAPVEMSSPDLSKKIDLTKYLGFQWAQIPNALGLYASIIGMEGKNTLILWSSSEVFKEGLMGDMGFLQMAEVREYVTQTVFMSGSRTSVNVPAGIFKNTDFTMFDMVGYGPGAARDNTQPLPRIQTKTKLSIMLGGRGMPDMGGMGEMDGDDEQKRADAGSQTLDH